MYSNTNWWLQFCSVNCLSIVGASGCLAATHIRCGSWAYATLA